VLSEENGYRWPCQGTRRNPIERNGSGNHPRSNVLEDSLQRPESRRSHDLDGLLRFTPASTFALAHASLYRPSTGENGASSRCRDRTTES